MTGKANLSLACMCSLACFPSSLNKCWEHRKTVELELYIFKDEYNIIRITDM